MYLTPTRDGFSGEDFHKKSDNQGPTLTVIVSQNGHIFGGFTPCSWDSCNEYKATPEAFLFTLTNPHAIPSSQYFLIPGDRCAIGCYKGEGAIFGYRGGNGIFIAATLLFILNIHTTFHYSVDIWLRSLSHQHSKSVVNFPRSYVDTTGKGNNTFTGKSSFTSLDVEVYAVVPT